MKINGVKVDGYNKFYDIAIEFHGRYWHTKSLEAYEKTIKRDGMLRRHTNLIKVWDNKWKKNPDAVIRRVIKRIDKIKEKANARGH